MACIIIGLDILDEGLEPLLEHHDVVRPPQGRDFTEEELMELLPTADILCSVFDLPVGKKLMDVAPRLRLIANYAVGYNNIDTAYAQERGIVVTNTPRSVVEPTAELAFALLLATSRKVVLLDRLLREQEGHVRITRNDLLGVDLYGKTIGIVGYGNIGASMARRAQAFGMHVLYYKRTPLSPEEELRLGIRYAPLDDLLQHSDVVSVHTPLSDASRHQIGARELGLMKSSAILINSARGPVVDEEALVEALEAKIIWGAGLDVFENRDTPHPRLLTLPNVVMTPHVGTQTYDARVAMTREMVANVLGFLAGRQDISRVV